MYKYLRVLLFELCLFFRTLKQNKKKTCNIIEVKWQLMNVYMHDWKIARDKKVKDSGFAILR